MPLLPYYDYQISLNERILLWQSQSGEGFFFKESVSINSLPIIVAEIEKLEKETKKIWKGGQNQLIQGLWHDKYITEIETRMSQKLKMRETWNNQ